MYTYLFCHFFFSTGLPKLDQDKHSHHSVSPAPTQPSQTADQKSDGPVDDEDFGNGSGQGSGGLQSELPDFLDSTSKHWNV